MYQTAAAAVASECTSSETMAVLAPAISTGWTL